VTRSAQTSLGGTQDRCVSTGYGFDVDPAALGHEVTAFITFEIRQADGARPSQVPGRDPEGPGGAYCPRHRRRPPGPVTDTSRSTAPCLGTSPLLP
jgi:hypothetical protein